ncbi:MAG: hypothetical protein QM784_04160 [Polyangiaceae bacterium]
MAFVGSVAHVVAESIDMQVDPNGSEPLRVMMRRGKFLRVLDPNATHQASLDASSDSDGETATIGAQALALPWLGLASQPAVKRLVTALGAIRLHVPFETRPLWQARELNINTGPRWPSVVETTRELSRFGVNLPSAFHVLRNRGDEVWQRVLERARLGLGEDVRDLVLSPVGRGNIELEVLFGAFPDAPVPAEQLSDGQIAYLSFLALCEFHSESSLLAFDEPENPSPPRALGSSHLDARGSINDGPNPYRHTL